MSRNEQYAPGEAAPEGIEQELLDESNTRSASSHHQQNNDSPVLPATTTAAAVPYRRRGSATLEEAILKFDDMKFVAGKGRTEKIIVSDVAATVSKGREYWYCAAIWHC